MIWNSQDRTFEVYFGDAGMQAFQAQQAELPPPAQRNLTVFVDANAGPENLLDATRLAVEMLPDYRLAIEREMLQLVDFQIVDSGATMHLGPVCIANAMMAPVTPPAPYVPVINLADFLFDEEDDNEDDDAEPFEPPPGGPSVWIAPAAPVLPIVRYSASMPSLKALTSLFSCFQPVRLSTLIQRWAPLLPLIWPAR